MSQLNYKYLYLRLLVPKTIRIGVLLPSVDVYA